MPDTIEITHTPATIHFHRAAAFYALHGQERSAIGEMAAGMLALSVQVARIELAVMQAHRC